jgi:hypothetical protein
LYPFSSCSKKLSVFLAGVLVCVSGAFATTTKPVKKLAEKHPAKTSGVKTTVHTGSHTAHSSSSKKTASKTSHKTTRSSASTHSSFAGNSKKLSAKGKSGRPKSKQTARSHGQQGIDGERARAIQEALIRAKYLQGEPSGVWDQQTKDALTHLQSDNGWQTKVVPDSRALIKLGLGPNHDNLLNPDSSGMGVAPAAGAGQAAQLQPGGSATNQ